MSKSAVAVAMPLLLALVVLGCKGPDEHAFDTKAMAEAAAAYDLRGEELAVMNECRKFSVGLRLSGQPDLATYCGCMSKHATEDVKQSYKVNALKFADELSREGIVEGKDVTIYFPVGSFRGTRADVVSSVKSAMSTCHGVAKANADRRRLAKS